MYPWQAPVPAKTGRFLAAEAKWKALNVEVALERIRPFVFTPAGDERVMLYDCQTQLDNTYPRRWGSGRGAVMDGYYLKGVGRTPVAANWNDTSERYHGSGHMPPSSAAKEWAVTEWLDGRGLGHSIVRCETILAAALTTEEKAELAQGHTSANARRAKGDGHMMVLSAKKATFARMSNVIWAFDHFSTETPHIGELFLAVDSLLRLPEDRDEAEGEPAALIEAMEQSYERGLANFRAWQSAGLYWLFLQNNFTLDGRYVDLETPFVMDEPVIGLRWRGAETERHMVGFEELYFVWCWRVFLNRWRRQLEFLLTPGILADKLAIGYVKLVLKELKKRFRPTHALYDDSRVLSEATRWLEKRWSLGAKARRELQTLATWRMDGLFRGGTQAEPDLGWKPVADAGALVPTGENNELLVPSWCEAKPTSGAVHFAERVAQLENCKTPKALFATLRQPQA